MIVLQRATGVNRVNATPETVSAQSRAIPWLMFWLMNERSPSSFAFTATISELHFGWPRCGDLVVFPVRQLLLNLTLLRPRTQCL